MPSKKIPAFQFYPADWLSDDPLQTCSLSAKGLWVQMLCRMHKSPVRGYLMLTAQKPMTREHLAQLEGIPFEQLSNCLAELVGHGVIDWEETEEGIVYSSRRMIRDEKKRWLCGEAGRKGGGNPNFKNQVKGDGKLKSKASSSSLSSSSTSSSTSISSSEKYHLTNLPGVGRVWASIPKNRQTKPATTKLEIARALQTLEAQPDMEAPVHFLVTKLSEYYDSPEGQGKFHRRPLTWLTDGGWEEDPETWQNREEATARETL